MSDYLSYFNCQTGTVAVSLPVDYQQVISDWSALRSPMVRHIPKEFSRDEWAYLVTFLEQENLARPFMATFGQEAGTKREQPSRLYRSIGPTAIWLPNNVSLLGPLTLILLSLTGQPIRLKLGSHADDLTGIFLKFAIAHLPDGELKTYLASQVTAERFEHGDERQKELAAKARVRIVFGSNEAAKSVHGLPHPLNSIGVSFADHQSEAWLEHSAINDQVLTTLIKVFAIYGQAGCTSPSRVILLDGTKIEAAELKSKLLELWPRVLRMSPPMHIASSNVLAHQWGRMLGWDIDLVQGNAAVLANGTNHLPLFDAPMALRIHCASRAEALEDLPENIQTIGYALNNPTDPAWLQLLSHSRALRFVPLARMHHFGSTWDGQEFWRQCFESMEIC